VDCPIVGVLNLFIHAAIFDRASLCLHEGSVIK